MILESPIQAPGSRLASEYHGGKRGRFCYHRVVQGRRAIYEPVRCKSCKQAAIIFDERAIPYCPACSQIHEKTSSGRLLSKPRDKRRRAREYKKFRLYGRQNFKPQD